MVNDIRYYNQTGCNMQQYPKGTTHSCDIRFKRIVAYFASNSLAPDPPESFKVLSHFVRLGLSAKETEVH